MQVIFFVMSLRPSDHKALQNIASSSSFFSISLGFLEFKEFNITIIPFAPVGYKTGYSQLGATHLFGYLPSHIKSALMQ